jgi:predicted enzyme related to lactoylglutathione lyase
MREVPIMHHSRLSTLVLDCQADDLADAAQFWSAALGKPIVTLDQDGDGRYAELATADDEPIILLQRVDHASRVHLDIETDDLEAEIARLQALGATAVTFVRERWWVMQAPSGHRFCVVRVQRESPGTHLNRWD